jgi:LmbE family N-acetylglucosaminyl deacetylase
MSKRAFAVGAHPDDIEFQMAGTLILLGTAGYELHCMSVANGSCGSSTLDRDETVATRRAEAEAACACIGAVLHESLTDDLAVFYEPGLLARLAAVVREVAPEILLTHSPRDYMEDHQNACRLAVTAAFVRGMRNFATAPPSAPVDVPVRVYHAQPHGNVDPLGDPLPPGIFVDVAPVMTEKATMLAAHRSQGDWLEANQSMASPVDEMKRLAAATGTASGRYALAEGWRRRGHLGFCDTSFDPLLTALGNGAFAVAGPGTGRGGTR